MRRLVAIGLVAFGALVPMSAADAQSAATMSSPSRAVAGAPIWVRSVTPCPATGGTVTAFVLSQEERTPGEKTMGDVAPDGSWVLTLSAPADMAAGITRSYAIGAACSDGGMSYAPRRLYVTGFGGGDSASGEVEAASADSGSTAAAVETASVAPVASSPKSVRAAEAQTPTAVVAQSVETSTTTTTWVSDEAERAAEARAELGRRTKHVTDDVALSASPVATTRRPTPDAGIPWWSFLLATMLAVGAVVGFGQRRRSV